MRSVRPSQPSGAPPRPREDRRGDIVGALGTIRLGPGRPRSARARLLAFLAIAGPGIIVMVGDNDAGGVVTYDDLVEVLVPDEWRWRGEMSQEHRYEPASQP